MTTQVSHKTQEVALVSDSPRIYVASLSDYNAGTLHGAWIDADQSAEEIHAEIQAMLAQSHQDNAEEWAIHDHEGFGGWQPSEYEDIETVSKLANAIVEHGEAVVWYVSNEGSIEYLDGFEEAYCGQWDSEEDYAQNLAEDIGAIPDDLSWPVSYIDWERATRDLFMGDYWSAEAADGGVYVFRSL